MNVLTAGGAGSIIPKYKPENLADQKASESVFLTHDDSAFNHNSPTRSCHDDNNDLSSSDGEEEQYMVNDEENHMYEDCYKDNPSSSASSHSSNNEIKPDDLYNPHDKDDAPATSDERPLNFLWLGFCFFGIMFSFVMYGYLLEFATTDGRKLHELSFLFVTSLLYTITAAAGRYVRQEVPSTIPPARFAILGMTSMGSTFCSVRSLRFVIFPIQVLAKSCKPVPVMIMGALMGKKYPPKKYINVCLIVGGVALFMGGGDTSKKDSTNPEKSSAGIIGIILLFISLCFDGGTGAYEDKLMSVHSVGPFDLMYNIQLGKTIIAFIGLIVLNQVNSFVKMCSDMGLVLIALGFTGAMGQVFIFVTIAKFGALTCSIIGLARKVTTLVVSIYIYEHPVNAVQKTGLVISVGAMILNFWGKKSSGGHGVISKETVQKPQQEGYAKSNINTKRSYSDNHHELTPVKAITAGTSQN